MTQIGIVEEVYGNHVKVRIKRASACGENCASCKGGCTPTEKVIEVLNKANAKVGDNVLLEMKNSKVLFAAMLVYIVPIVALIFGYILGNFIVKTEGKSILIGLACMGIVLFVVSKIDKKLESRYTVIAVNVL